jgi:hypothetical protein
MQDKDSQTFSVPTGSTADAQVAQKIDSEERREELNRVLNESIRKGWKVESQTDFTATIVKGKRPNHILHLILSVVTALLWVPVWIFLSITKHEDRRLIQVDETGAVRG